jgi:hypothetical protein
MRTILVVLASTAWSAPGIDPWRAPVESGALDMSILATPCRRRGASQEQIIESVQKRYNAKVVRVTETTVEGRPALRLRLLSAQRVWTMVVDADSGQVLGGVMRILVVEDEAALRESLKHDLSAAAMPSTSPPMARKDCTRH